MTAVLSLATAACATTPAPLADRQVTPVEWDAVVECVTLSARASNREAIVRDYFVYVPAYLSKLGVEETIVFIRRETKQGFVVITDVQARDWRAGNARPIGGATQETRQLRRQLAQQCLGRYPSVAGARTE